MPRKLNLCKQRFNKLTVLEDSGERNASGGVLWLCQCECGAITKASSTELKNGHKKSCGCLQKETAAEQGRNNLIDLTNKIFDQLTVIRRVSTKKTPSGATKIFWLCKCSCGNNCIVEGNALKTGNTKSCGCIKSFGEQKIISLLQQYGIPFEKEKIFDKQTNYRYDFYIDNKYVIEYDGKQHYCENSWESMDTIIKRDMEKNQYCYTHNIPIIRIPFTHYNKLNIEDLILETTSFLIFKSGEEET